MTNSLTIYENGNFDLMQRTAKAMSASGFFKDSTDEAKAIVKVMAGAELGLPPFASMTGISIIQGKPVIGANAIATLVKNDPRYDYAVKKADDTSCVIAWKEGGAVVGESGFTIKEAKTAGLTNKDNWKKYPSDMLFARAISRGAKRFVPGIFGGAPVYTPDEMGVDVDPEGYIEGVVIEETGEIIDALPEPTPMSERPKSLRDTLAETKKPTLKLVADAAVTSGLYDNDFHAWNAVKLYDGFPEGFKVQKSTVVKPESAVKIFDFLMNRKQEVTDG